MKGGNRGGVENDKANFFFTRVSFLRFVDSILRNQWVFSYIYSFKNGLFFFFKNLHLDDPFFYTEAICRSCRIILLHNFRKRNNELQNCKIVQRI